MYIFILSPSIIINHIIVFEYRKKIIKIIEKIIKTCLFEISKVGGYHINF